jgi:hypothetical protein
MGGRGSAQDRSTTHRGGFSPKKAATIVAARGLVSTRGLQKGRIGDGLSGWGNHGLDGGLWGVTASRTTCLVAAEYPRTLDWRPRRGGDDGVGGGGASGPIGLVGVANQKFGGSLPGLNT